MNITIIISVLSFAISIFGVYLTHLRKAKIITLLSENIMVQYFKDGFGLYLPISFINISASVGIVNRVSLELIRLDNPKRKYNIKWTHFRKYNDSENNWKFDDHCYHLPIDGKKGITKMIWFDWALNSDDIWQAERYSIKVSIWTNGFNKISHSKKYYFNLTEEYVSILNQRKIDNNNRLLEVGIENYIESNIIT